MSLSPDHCSGQRAFLPAGPFRRIPEVASTPPSSGAPRPCTSVLGRADHEHPPLVRVSAGKRDWKEPFEINYSIRLVRLRIGHVFGVIQEDNVGLWSRASSDDVLARAARQDVVPVSIRTSVRAHIFATFSRGTRRRSGMGGIVQDVLQRVEEPYGVPSVFDTRRMNFLPGSNIM